MRLWQPYEIITLVFFCFLFEEYNNYPTANQYEDYYHLFNVVDDDDDDDDDDEIPNAQRGFYIA